MIQLTKSEQKYFRRDFPTWAQLCDQLIPFMVKGSGISAHHLRKDVDLTRSTQNRAKRYTYFPPNESWSK